MKYIRAEDKVIEINPTLTDEQIDISLGKDTPRADTIEELCDEFVVIDKEKNKHIFDTFEGGFLHKGQYGIDFRCYTDRKYKIYGAIWTDKGLQFVALMNNSEGVWKLL